ncbi:MAG: hypothetical protein GDA56_01355 [Hormoscilla sp. GM7CHS1pb]|nr:hypothetical protein [Hormoscilla sp. GM7CHS1pb]
MTRINPAQRLRNPSLTLYAFHLRSDISKSPQKEEVERWWKQLEKLSQPLQVRALRTLRDKLICYQNGQYDPNAEDVLLPSDLSLLRPGEQIDLPKVRQLGSQLGRLERSTMVELYRIHDTYATDLTLFYEEGILPIFQLGHYLNPQNCLLPQNLQASLGQTLVLFAEPVGEVEDYQLLASECVAQLLQKEKPPQLIARGVLCGSQLFEYDTQESDPSKRCHIWVWFGQKESLDLIQQASGYLLNLLCCRHKILYIEYQSRYCNQKARELYSWLEERIKLPQLNDAVTERVEPLKNLLVELPEKQLRYEHFWRDMEDHKTAIATNLDNYRQLLNSIPANEGDDREFLDKFGNLTESKYQRQIEVELIFLAPGRSLFTQLVATIRGLVEIETQKFLQKQEESDRRLERIIQIWGVGLGVGGIVASSSEHIDKELKESVGIENIHPFAASLSLNVFVTLVVAGIMWWLTRPRHRHKSPDKK